MKKDSLINSIVLIISYLGLEILLSLIYSFFKIKNHLIDSIALTIISLIILFYIVYRLRNKLDGQWTDFKKNIKPYLKKALKYWLIGFSLMIISNVIINLIIPNGLAPNEALNRQQLKDYPVYSCLSICIIGPLTEELLFRLNFKGTVKGRTNFILLTSFLFSLMHILFSTTNLIEIIYIIPYSMLGLAFGALYYDTNNIYTSTFAHTFHNTLATFIILLGI